MSDELRDMLAASVKEAEGKEESVVEAADKLEPKEPEAKEPPAKEPEAKEPPTKEPEGKEPEAKEPEGKEPEAKEPTEPLLAQDKAPAGWNPKVREQWATLPQDVRQEIIRREEASAVGVRKLQAEMEPLRGFVQQLDPFIQEAFQSGANPGQYIGQVMASERALRNPDQNARFEALLQIADNYRIPLREVINESVGREVLSARPQTPQIDPAVQRELQENRQWRAEQEQQALAKQIEEFSKNAEFFEDVRPMMADLITANPRLSLQQVYDSAIWADPTIREVLQSRTSKSTELAKKQAAAAGTSIAPNNEVNVRTKLPDSERTLEDDLRDSIAAAQGRV